MELTGTTKTFVIKAYPYELENLPIVVIKPKPFKGYMKAQRKRW